MKIYLGADHRGFELKEQIKAALTAKGHVVHDLGAHRLIPNDDYPDYAALVAERVAEEPNARGILVCGSGFGVEIAANKFDGIRAGNATSENEILAGRRDDDVNILALAADATDEPTALRIIKTFLTTPFGNEERYIRRLKKIKDIEARN